MKNPLVSVIVPVYNAEQYLRECLAGLLSQTYSNIEIILMDDGSVDGSAELCDKYADIDKRIKVFHQCNKGVSNARNNGVKNSNGEYITFVDADDTVKLDLIEKLVFLVEKYSADVAYCGINIIDLKGNIEIGCETSGEKTVNKIDILKGFFVDPTLKLILYGPYNKLFKKSLCEKIAFDEALRIGEDLLYVYEILRQAEVIAKCDDCLYNYIKRTNSATTSKFSEKKLDFLLSANQILQLSKKDKVEDIAEIWYYGHVIDFCRLILAYSEVKKRVKDQFLIYRKYLKANRKKMWGHLSKKKKLSYFFVAYFPISWRIFRALGYKV